MILQEKPVLEELALFALVQSPGATAKRITQMLAAQGHSYSLRGVYKELTKLVEQGILFKRGESFNVRLAWILNLLALGDRAFDQYTGVAYLSGIIGKESGGSSAKKYTEKFSNLRTLDRFWTQLILTLHTLHPGKIMCFWCPYQWFYLAHYFTAKQFYSAIDLTGHNRCHIIGHDSYLGRRALKDLPKNGKYSFAASPFERETSTYYTVIADTVITVKLDKQITEKIDRLFRTVKGAADIDPEELELIFGSRVKTTLTIERSEQKAGRLKTKFSDFFGIEIP